MGGHLASDVAGQGADPSPSSMGITAALKRGPKTKTTLKNTRFLRVFG